TVVVGGGEVNANVCPASFLAGSAVTLGGCACGGAAFVSTRSIGYPFTGTTETTVGYLGVTLLFRAQIFGPLGIIVEGGLRFPLGGLVGEVEGVGPIERTATIAGTVAMGLDLRLP